jgi:hypothetical protein
MGRKKTVVIIGHSNGEGQAGSDPMIVAAPWLANRGIPAHFGNTGSPGSPNYVHNTNYTPAVLDQFYKNLWVFTSALGYPSGNKAGGTTPQWSPPYPTKSTIGQGRWLPMCTYLPSRDEVGKVSPSDASQGTPGIHPFSSEAALELYRLKGEHFTPQLSPIHSPFFAYPNTRSLPVPPDWYDASGAAGIFGSSGGGTLVGIEFPLCNRLAHKWGEPCYLVKLSIPGSLLNRYDQGESALANYSWFTPLEEFDWHPHTDRLFKEWETKMAAAHAELVASGDKLDVQLVVLWVGDNDSNRDADRIQFFEDSYIALMKAVRAKIHANDWSSLPSHQIPIIVMGIYQSYDNIAPTNPATINTILRNIVREDKYADWVETDGFNNLVEDGYPLALGAGGHFGHTGYLDAADAVYDAYAPLVYLGEDALGIENRVTRAEVRNRVFRYYSRGQTRTDATSDTTNQHINGALFHIINIMGDNAWWLRKMENMTISAAPNQPYTMPKTVHRIIRIESDYNPSYPLRFEMLGYTSNGKLQILLHERWTGTFRVHFITQPVELSHDEENIPLPYNLIEWLVVEAARRLAFAGGDIELQASLHGQARQLQHDAMRNVSNIERPRFDRRLLQRRLVNRRNLHGRTRVGW